MTGQPVEDQLKSGQTQDGSGLSMAEGPIPEGYELSSTRGPYTSHNGPFYHKVTPEGFWHGTRLLHRHCNGGGIAHGGMLMAFADGLLGTAVFRHTNRAGVTVRMTSDFLSSAREGDWLEGTGRVTQSDGDFIFCEAEMFVAGTAVLRASGVFKLVKWRRGKV